MPEDVAALFVQWARVIHKVDPGLKLGGPSFEGVNQDIKVWPDSDGRVSWFGRFLDYLRDHKRSPSSHSCLTSTTPTCPALHLG